MKLNEPIMLSLLAQRLPEAQLNMWQDLEITELVDDSRHAHRKALFLAYPDDQVWRYIADAQRRGAMAILIDAQTRDAIPPIAVASLVVRDVSESVAILAEWATGQPAQDLTLLGVTGTNGKTTTSAMIAAMLRALPRQVGVIGTLGVKYGDVEFQTGYTTPPALKLQEIFGQMRMARVDTVVMEVSSQALCLGRVARLRFAVGLLTNISQDHLDFHKTMEGYIAAKKQLFKQSDATVINMDDAVGRQYFQEFGGIGYSLQARGTWSEIAASADILYAEGLELTAQGSRFRVNDQVFTVNLPGRFNSANALGAIGVLRALGVSLSDAAHGLAQLLGVPGRMERFSAGGCTVFVDYAHTPDALERVLTTARESHPTRVTVVFGCGGSRDAGKRPLMGAVAERCADRCILTTDNPRDEDPRQIIAQIQAGREHPAEIELDRVNAIVQAICESIEGEIVVVAGKGAETVQIFGRHRTPFDDREVVRHCLRLRQVSR